MSQRTRYCSRCLTTFTNDVERCPNLSCRSVRPAPGWGELLEAGETIDRTYKIRQRLAIGGAGVTYLAREIGTKNDEVGPLLAVKVLYQQRDQGQYLRRLATEAQILQGLNHAQIVECRGFVHRTGHSPYLVTRFEAGGSLLDHIRRVGSLSIPTTASIGRQICWALEVAHRQKVVHRDLKPENVLLVKQVSAETIPDLKVADFGIAKVSGGIGDRLTRVGAFIGTPQYAAPEQFEGLTPGPAADVYALGAVMYFLLTLHAVADFMGELDPEDQREQLIRHLPVRLAEVNAPGHLRRWMEDTLAMAMQVDPADRCDLATLDRRLADIAAERDPGHVPVGPPRDLPTSTPTISAGISDGLPLDGEPSEERPNEERPRAEQPVERLSNPPRAWRDDSPGPGAVVPDPAAGTADPIAPPPLPPVIVPDPVMERLQRPPDADDPPWEPVPAVHEPRSLRHAGDPPPIPPGLPPDISLDPPVESDVHPPVSEALLSPPDRPSEPVRSSFPPPEILAPPPDLRSSPFPEEPTPSRAGAMMGVGVVGLLGGGGVLALLAGVGLYFGLSGGPQALTGQESDPTIRKDWEMVAGALGTAGVRAERTCKSPPYLAIEATVQPTGQITAVELLNYDHEATRACMERELSRERMPRNTGLLVRVAITLQE